MRVALIGSSATAFELARHLAVAPVTLPVARAVQALIDRSEPSHLAEVLLSGLIERLAPPPTPDEDPDRVVYDFRPGVREELLRTLTRGNAFMILDELADRSDRIAGSIGTTDLFELADRPTFYLAQYPESRVAAAVAVTVFGALGGTYAEAADRVAAALDPVVIPRPDTVRGMVEIAARGTPPHSRSSIFQFTASFKMSRNNQMPHAHVARLTPAGAGVAQLSGG